jgi:hypothetical protein
MKPTSCDLSKGTEAGRTALRRTIGRRGIAGRVPSNEGCHPNRCPSSRRWIVSAAWSKSSWKNAATRRSSPRCGAPSRRDRSSAPTATAPIQSWLKRPPASHRTRQADPRTESQRLVLAPPRRSDPGQRSSLGPEKRHQRALQGRGDTLSAQLSCLAASPARQADRLPRRRLIPSTAPVTRAQRAEARCRLARIPSKGAKPTSFGQNNARNAGIPAVIV